MAGRLSQGIDDVVARNRSDVRTDRRRLAKQGMAEHVNVGTLERLTSALAGAALAAWGLRRRGATGYGAALLGAELVYRGASGHCHAYSALGISTHEHPERGTPAALDPAKSIDVRHSVIINRPRE
jgi:uncharacterized membrane protein